MFVCSMVVFAGNIMSREKYRFLFCQFLVCVKSKNPKSKKDGKEEKVQIGKEKFLGVMLVEVREIFVCMC